MRRELLLLLAVMATVVSMAADVTPQQALQEAQRFVQERAKVSGRRVAATPQLTLVSRVSDLYVFNAADNGGFVIVSNDDCVETVLGYSDTGAFDPNNIPDNMRGWLQGYADEIAWAKTHNIQKSAGSAPRRTSTVKTAIAPLIQTRWNQGAPYNNLCPEYKTDNKSVTGCVATAMAQVMYYYKCPAGNISSEIPAYSKGTNDEDVRIPLTEALPIIAFDWTNMQLYYSGSESDEQNTAVAQLMYYCGCSAKMNYGSSSGTSTSFAVSALKEYYGYDATTQYVSRSYYTYANWIELIYNELKSNRVVFYDGQSATGGHAFVCDGYQTEDYFHINWGWGGLSDGHFKLSALSPEAQGAGGNNSDDGYNTMQGAIIGIQPNGAGGTILDVPNNAPNLTLNSITLSKTSITLGETIDVTLNVTNKSSNEYDGDLYVYNSYLGMNGKTFVIAAGATKDCVISYTPSGYTGTNFYIQGCYPSSGGGYYTWDSPKAYLNVTSGSGSSTNVDLTLSISAENAELASESTYNLYGNFFKPTVRLTNSTDTDYSGTLYWQILESTFFGSFSLESVSVNVPKNSSVDVILTEQFLDASKNYKLYTSYNKNNVLTSKTYTYFNLQPAIMTYAADGTITVTKPIGTTLDVSSSTALAIDVTGTGITSITPNSEPNAVYIYSGIKPSGLDGKIVVEKNGSTYTAGNITITDGSGFYSPVDFTAENIEFNYAFTVAANGTNGWNTIMLPFDVTKVTYGGVEKQWFNSSEDTGKHFWLKSFTSDAASNVYFDFVSGTTMTANTPYIVAFPGDRWGDKWDMSKEQIKFVGANTTVHKGGTLSTVTGSNYRFIGNTVQDNTENIYTINAEGNSFVLNETGGCAPFRAFFKPGSFDRAVTSLGIGSGTNTTGIENAVKSEELKDKSYYNLNGQRVAQPTKGLYIVNGKKVIVK